MYFVKVDIIHCMKTGAGNAFLGWIDLPENYDGRNFPELEKPPETRNDSDVLLVIGIGGSYLERGRWLRTAKFFTMYRQMKRPAKFFRKQY